MTTKVERARRRKRSTTRRRTSWPRRSGRAGIEVRRERAVRTRPILQEERSRRPPERRHLLGIRGYR